MLDYIQIIFIIVFSLLALSCIITNCLIFYISITRTTIGGVFKYYICSLAITDILIGVVSIPGDITFEIILIKMPNEMDILLNATGMFLAVCSLWHISLMAFDRVMAICKPIFHRIHMKTKNAALKLSLIPWILSALVTTVNFGTSESFRIRYEFITTSIFGIALPFISTVVCYIIVFVAIKKRNREISHIARSLNIVNEKRILKMILCVLAVFIFCWSPFAIIDGMASYLRSSIDHSQYLYIINAANFLRFMNSTCNPFVYAIFYPSYRKGVKDVLKGCFCRKGNSSSNRVMQSQETEETKL